MNPPTEYEDERDARFINDRVHANIQKDGTFSVVPRIYGGVTTAAELMRIAEVAVKYQVPMVKLTGGQRIDLLGIKKEDLPAVWKDLDMPSGHAYTKSFRTCKSCVGTDFCRYGLGDSIALAQKIERRFQGVESPHKMKLATAGCPRNCSEAYVKDLGAVAVEGLRAQAKPPVFTIAEIDVSNVDAYGKEYAPKAQALIREKLRIELRRFFRKRSGRRPFVLPVIMEI
jgi:nitrite reductase (NADH) large subunit